MKKTTVKMESRKYRLEFLVILIIYPVCFAENLLLSVDFDQPISVTNEKFLSLTIDPATLLRSNALSTNFEKSTNMAKALSPAYLRIGGPQSNSFVPEGPAQPSDKEKDSNLVFSETYWIRMHQWAERADLDVIACIAPEYIQSGQNKDFWNSKSPPEIISFSDLNGYNMSWQLGYECQTRCEKSANKIGKRVLNLRKILNEFPRYSGSIISGPDIVAFKTIRQQEYLRTYFSVAAPALSAVTWHPKLPDVQLNTDGVSMIDDNLPTDKDELYKVIGHFVAGRPLWIAESKEDEYKKAFTDALIWTRRLGSAAKVRAEVILRHPSDLTQPTPDFWVSLLHKNLVDREVFYAKISTENEDKIEFYCQCTKSSGRYVKGSITIFGINLTPDNVAVNLEEYKITTLHEYILQSGLDTPDWMFSKRVKLNNKTLSLINDTYVPDIKPLILTNPNGLQMNLPPGAIGFWVLPDLKIKSCTEEHELPTEKYRKPRKRTIRDNSFESSEEDEDKPTRRHRIRNSQPNKRSNRFRKNDVRKELRRLRRFLKKNFASHETNEDTKNLFKFQEEMWPRLKEYKDRLLNAANRGAAVDVQNIPNTAAEKSLVLICKIGDALEILQQEQTAASSSSSTDATMDEMQKNTVIKVKDHMSSLYELLKRADLEDSSDTVLSEGASLKEDKSRAKRDLGTGLTIDDAAIAKKDAPHAKKDAPRRRSRNEEVKGRRSERKNKRKEDIRKEVQPSPIDPKFTDSGENNFYGFFRREPKKGFPEGDVFFDTGDSAQEADYDYVKDEDVSEEEGSRKNPGSHPGKDSLEPEDVWIEDANDYENYAPNEFFENMKLHDVRILENLKDPELLEVEDFGENKESGDQQTPTLPGVGVHTNQQNMEQLPGYHNNFGNGEISRNSRDENYGTMNLGLERFTVNPKVAQGSMIKERHHGRKPRIQSGNDQFLNHYGGQFYQISGFPVGNYDASRGGNRRKRDQKDLDKIFDQEMINEDADNNKDCNCRVIRDEEIISHRTRRDVEVEKEVEGRREVEEDIDEVPEVAEEELSTEVIEVDPAIADKTDSHVEENTDDILEEVNNEEVSKEVARRVRNQEEEAEDTGSTAEEMAEVTAEPSSVTLSLDPKKSLIIDEEKTEETYHPDHQELIKENDSEFPRNVRQLNHRQNREEATEKNDKNQMPNLPTAQTENLFRGEEEAAQENSAISASSSAKLNSNFRKNTDTIAGSVQQKNSVPDKAKEVEDEAGTSSKTEVEGKRDEKEKETEEVNDKHNQNIAKIPEKNAEDKSDKTYQSNARNKRPGSSSSSKSRSKSRQRRRKSSIERRCTTNVAKFKALLALKKEIDRKKGEKLPHYPIGSPGTNDSANQRHLEDEAKEINKLKRKYREKRDRILEEYQEKMMDVVAKMDDEEKRSLRRSENWEKVKEDDLSGIVDRDKIDYILMYKPIDYSAARREEKKDGGSNVGASLPTAEITRPMNVRQRRFNPRRNPYFNDPSILSYLNPYSLKDNILRLKNLYANGGEVNEGKQGEDKLRSKSYYALVEDLLNPRIFQHRDKPADEAIRDAKVPLPSSRFHNNGYSNYNPAQYKQLGNYNRHDKIPVENGNSRDRSSGRKVYVIDPSTYKGGEPILEESEEEVTKPEVKSKPIDYYKAILKSEIDKLYKSVWNNPGRRGEIYNNWKTGEPIPKLSSSRNININKFPAEATYGYPEKHNGREFYKTFINPRLRENKNNPVRRPTKMEDKKEDATQEDKEDPILTSTAEAGKQAPETKPGSIRNTTDESNMDTQRNWKFVKIPEKEETVDTKETTEIVELTEVAQPTENDGTVSKEKQKEVKENAEYKIRPETSAENAPEAATNKEAGANSSAVQSSRSRREAGSPERTAKFKCPLPFLLNKSPRGRRRVGRHNYICLKEDSDESSEEVSSEVFKLIKKNNHYKAVPVGIERDVNQESIPDLDYLRLMQLGKNDPPISARNPYSRSSLSKNSEYGDLLRLLRDSVQDGGAENYSTQDLIDVNYNADDPSSSSSSEEDKDNVSDSSCDSNSSSEESGSKSSSEENDEQLNLEDLINSDKQIVMVLPWGKENYSRFRRNVQNQDQTDESRNLDENLPAELEDLESLEINPEFITSNKIDGQETASKASKKQSEKKEAYINNEKSKISKKQLDDKNFGLPSLIEGTIPGIENVILGGFKKARNLTGEVEQLIGNIDEDYSETLKTEETNSEDNNVAGVTNEVFHTAMANIKKFFSVLGGLSKILHN